jgi:HrpA-like RNA helicase
MHASADIPLQKIPNTFPLFSSFSSFSHCIEHGYPTIVGARRFPLTIHWLDDMATMNIGGGGGGLEPNGHATPTTTLPSCAVQEAKTLCRQRVNVHAPVSQQYTKVEGNRFMFSWRHLFHVLTCFFFVLSTIVSLFKVSLAFDIARHVGTPGRSVLIFVSGIAQITDFVDRFNEIKERGRGRNHYVVIPIHSDIPFHEQMLAFDQAVLEEEVGSGEEGETKSHQPVPRKRTLPIKIVVATNAAESSITLPDCDHVICLGTAKRGTKMLVESPCLLKVVGSRCALCSCN